MIDLEGGEGQGEEGGRDDVESKAEERRERECEVGEGDQAVVERNGAFPGEAAEECAALVFLVVGKGGEVEDEKVGEGKRCQRKQQCCEQARHFSGLQEKCDGWDDVGDVNREDEFAESAVDEMEGRDGVYENEDHGCE